MANKSNSVDAITELILLSTEKLMKTCLIICRNPADLSTLKRLTVNDLSVVVASDDPRVQELARNIDGVREVVSIEKKESFFVVASDVKKTIGKIDKWLCSLNPSLPKGILAWGTQIEGGITSQRVQDVLLLIRSYLFLFSAYDVSEVHTIADPLFGWEDDVLKACAEANSLLFQRHITARGNIWKSVFIKRLLPFARAAYFLLHEVLMGGGRLWRRKSKIDLNGAIIFQLNASSRKHVENVRYIISALAERGQRPVVLCWSAGGRIVRPTGMEQLSGSGIPTIGLERFVTLVDMLNSLLQTVVIFLIGQRRLSQLATLSYEDVPLRILLQESFRYFFVSVLPQRIRYAKALHMCLLSAKPTAIKPWGGADFFEGKLALQLLHDGEGPMYIHYWVGAGIPKWPYTDRTYRPDVFLAKSPFEAELAVQEYGLSDSQVEVAGQARFQKLHLFAAHNSAEMSQRFLNLPFGGKLYVGVDPGGVLRGYQSYREQLEIITSVLRAAQRMSGLIVVIKPHPSYGIEHLLPLIASYNKCSNIVALSKTAPVDQFMNAIDILVTKFSTLILEAALMGRCAVSAFFDGEERFKVFGDLPEIVNSGEDLYSLIIRLASNRKVFEHWRAERLFHQKELLPRYYYNCNSPASIAAERIIKDLRCLQ